MSANAKPAVKVVNNEETVVPAQNSGEPKAVVQEAAAADTMIDALKKIEDRLAEGVTVTIKVHEDGKIDLDVVEDGGKAKKLVTGVKGVYQRNKRLVLSTGALILTSAALKVIAARREALAADDVVETSDEVSTEA